MRPEEGMNRRDMLCRAGRMVAGFSVGSALLEVEAHAAPNDREDAVVGFVMDGGPSQAAFFDAKVKVREQHDTGLRAIQTQVPGLVFGEILENTSKIAHLLTVIHTVESGHRHDIGMRDLLLDDEEEFFPSLLVKQSLKSAGSLAYIRADIPGHAEALYDTPNACREEFHGQLFALNNALKPKWKGLDGEEFEHVFRETRLLKRNMLFALSPAKGKYTPPLLQSIYGDDNFGEKCQLLSSINLMEHSSPRIDAHEQQARRAIALITGKSMQGVEWDPPESYLRDHGESSHAKAIWIASELLRIGVKSILLRLGHWDTHEGEAAYLKKYAPGFDVSFSWLVQQIESGALPPSLVWVAGEFGRSAKVGQPKMGRDHHRIQSAALYGRHLKKGSFGETNDCWEPDGKTYPLPDLKHIIGRASGRQPIDPATAAKYTELYMPST